MSAISLEQANTIITAALEEGRRVGLKPLTVSVHDAGGHLIAAQRQDGSSNLRPKVAAGKAVGALALGVSSRTIGAMAAERPSFVASLSGLCEVGPIPVAGGVIVVNADGEIIGAVGVTGDTSDNDEACALVGIKAAGLTAQG